MKKFSKNIGTLLVAILFVSSSIAQTVEAYKFAYSPTIINTGGKIFVKNFTNTGNIEANFGEKYAKSIKAALNRKSLGLTSGIKLTNPWLTTKFYEVVDTEAEADYIISGEYVFKKGSSSENKENVIYETSSMAKPKLPIHYYNYTEASSASITMKMYIHKKGNEKPSKIFPFTKTESKSKTTALEKPAITSSSSYISTLSKQAINKYTYEFTPRLVVEKYKFKTIKPSDKELKKEYKTMKSSLKAFAEQSNINEMGKIYLSMLEKENDADVHANLGICYELIGNFTKAQAEYNAGGDKKGIERITFMIKVRESHKAVGITVVENEF